jgi:hypothetical protein
MDLNNDSKTLLKSDENKKNTLMKNSIKNSFKHFESISTFNKEKLKKSTFMQNVPSKIKGLSNLKNSIQINNVENFNNQPNQNYEKIVTLNMPEMNSDISRNNTLQINEKDENNSKQSIKTINKLSKSLLKKVKKKNEKEKKKEKNV